MGESLAGRVALVTGSSRAAGIGLAIARELAAAGADLFLATYTPYDRQQPWGLGPGDPDEAVAGLRAGGTAVETLELDLAEPGAAAELMAAVHERYGRLDVLVNNAACSESGGIAELDAGQLDRHYAVNLRAPALLAAEMVRRHPRGRPGRIINITSGQGLAPMPGELAYAASKGGLEALTLSLGRALAGRGITVNAVDPGPTDTGWMTPELKRDLERASPTGRVGEPADTARVVAFLASDRAAAVTGQVIRARGAS